MEQKPTKKETWLNKYFYSQKTKQYKINNNRNQKQKK